MSFFQRVASRFKRMFGGDPAQSRTHAGQTDEWTAARTQHDQQDLIGNTGGAPPNWVPPTDEGRPRH